MKRYDVTCSFCYSCGCVFSIDFRKSYEDREGMTLCEDHKKEAHEALKGQEELK